jgi:hypothetical protein
LSVVKIKHSTVGVSTPAHIAKLSQPASSNSATILGRASRQREKPDSQRLPDVHTSPPDQHVSAYCWPVNLISHGTTFFCFGRHRPSTLVSPTEEIAERTARGQRMPPGQPAMACASITVLARAMSFYADPGAA